MRSPAPFAAAAAFQRRDAELSHSRFARNAIALQAIAPNYRRPGTKSAQTITLEEVMAETTCHMSISLDTSYSESPAALRASDWLT